jgi:hypothetical protein
MTILPPRQWSLRWASWCTNHRETDCCQPRNRIGPPYVFPSFKAQQPEREGPRRRAILVAGHSVSYLVTGGHAVACQFASLNSSAVINGPRASPGLALKERKA